MSKFIAIWRKIPTEIVSPEKLRMICRLLEPDNIQANQPIVYTSSSWSYGIMNPVKSVLSSDSGLMLGNLLGNYPNWDRVGEPVPDGTFALVRNAEDLAEICTDYTGSRSIWYCMAEEEMIVSSSQRAIVMYLGNLEWNDEVIPWMLSTGSLGPYLSWDKRIKLLPGNAILKLEKAEWNYTIQRTAFEYKGSDKKDVEIKADLLQSISRTFANLDLRKADWAVTLSGGKDSRGIFLLTQKLAKIKGRLPTFTYGLKGQEKVKNTDGYIAKRLSDKYGASNEYFDAFSLSTNETIETICNRLLKAGEGRVDHIVAYLDGMQFWKHLFESGVDGIIRGDVAFGFPIDIVFKSHAESQHYGQAFLCKEWSNLKSLPEQLLETQQFKHPFLKYSEENYNDHHDRFYIEYRLPIILAALSDFKTSYVEVINPLLSRDIFNQIQYLGTHLRKGSPIWKPYVENLEPSIPFANNTSFDLGLNEMDKDAFRVYLMNTIEKSPYLPDYLKSLALWEEKSGKGFKGKIRKMFRQSTLKTLLSFKQRFLIWRITGGNRKMPKLPKEKIRNRVFIVAEMYRILLEDSNILNK
jgi:hypothetical protein